MDLLCRKCSAFHWDFERLGGRDTPVFRACCNDGKVGLPMIKAWNFCPPAATTSSTGKARARAFRSGPTQFCVEPCLYRINIDETFYFQKV
ncbi:BQ5605_C015g07735 [Microbotryum silenes-dioicae]|uniref:BQ5605_C015g07735 protein n=1 Tax=Microbotryum silenes-dioicae TaxID=796604 RepID=A0A2X0NVY0_9BASI|nr:BQ5605_C015g07735 [Microbotryum silenes-dioicae]